MAKGNFGKKGHHENWTKVGIKALQEGRIDGIKMTEVQARRTFDNAYRKALRQAKASGDNINVAREVYYSMFARGTQRFDIKLKASDTVGDGISTSSTVSSTIKRRSTQTIDGVKYQLSIEQRFVSQRLEKLADTYDEVADIVKEYKKGNISLNELSKKVKTFKEENKEYLTRSNYKE